MYVHSTLLACPIRATVISWSFIMLARIWLLLAPGNRASAYVAPCVLAPLLANSRTHLLLNFSVDCTHNVLSPCVGKYACQDCHATCNQQKFSDILTPSDRLGHNLALSWLLTPCDHAVASSAFRREKKLICI